MKKFLKDLENELKKMKINNDEIREILADHEEMMNEALKEGLSEKELATKFGNPEKIAQDLFEDLKSVDTNLNEYLEKGEFSAMKDYDLYKSFPLSELKEIRINLISEDFELYPYDGNQIEVYFKNVTSPEKYEISLEKGVFELNRKKSIQIFSINRNDGDIIVRYPNFGKLSEYNVESVSGDCQLKGIEVKNLNLKSTSGDLDVQGVLADKAEISTVSGNIKLLDMQLESLAMSAVSGDYDAKDIKVSGEINANTVSGDFEFNNVVTKKASFRSVSGDLEAKEFYVESVNLKSVSGDINIENEDKTKPITNVKKRTLSGNINIR